MRTGEISFKIYHLILIQRKLPYESYLIIAESFQVAGLLKKELHDAGNTKFYFHKIPEWFPAVAPCFVSNPMDKNSLPGDSSFEDYYFKDSITVTLIMNGY